MEDLVGKTLGKYRIVGKLGSGELDYYSDLDLIFVRQPGEAGAQATSLAEKMLRLLTLSSPEGAPYEIDTRLRTEGRSAPLAPPPLTVVAFGTSVPELAASAVAAYRGHSDIAVGNIVGSNLFNILGIGGLAALVTPLPVAGNILSFDIWVMLGATVMMWPILIGHWNPGRGSGIVLLLLYGAYITINGYTAGLFS